MENSYTIFKNWEKIWDMRKSVKVEKKFKKTEKIERKLKKVTAVHIGNCYCHEVIATHTILDFFQFSPNYNCQFSSV